MFTLFRCPQTRTRTPTPSPTPTPTRTHFHASTLPLPLPCRRVRRDPHELVASSLIVGHNAAAALTAALSTAAHNWHIPSFGSLLTPLRLSALIYDMSTIERQDNTAQHYECARCLLVHCTCAVLCCSLRVLAKYSTQYSRLSTVLTEHSFIE